MNLVGISINHKTSPLQLREALHLNREEIIELISSLKKSIFAEGVVISTCNRTEIFGFPQNESIDANKLIDQLKNIKPMEGIKPEHFSRYI